MFTKKEGARIGSTLFKTKWGDCALKLSALLKRNFLYETFSSKFLRSHSFEVLLVASCKRLYKKSTLSKVNKESNDIFRCQQNICSEKIQKQPFTDILQSSSSSKFQRILRKTPVLESFFDAVAGLRAATALKMTPAKVFSCDLIEILRTPFFTEHLRIGNFQGKHLYRSPVPVTLGGTPCDFIKVGLCREHFQKNIETLLFRDRYS